MLHISEDKNKMFFQANVYLTAPKDGTVLDKDSSVKHLLAVFLEADSEYTVEYTNGEVKNSMEEME